MNTEGKTKINQLLQKQPPGALFFSEWMYKNGISYELQRRYRETQWLTSIGTGVMIRTKGEPTIFSAVSSLNEFNFRKPRQAACERDLRFSIFVSCSFSEMICCNIHSMSISK